MTISVISRTNTIDEWRIQTNQSATELNTIESGAYVKNNGTFSFTNTSSLIITSQGTALQVSNSALIQKDVTIGNELDVGVESSRTGNVSVGNIVEILGQNNSLRVANGAILGSATVNTNIQVGQTLSSNLIYANNATINSSISIAQSATANSIYANNITVNTSLTIGNTVNSLNLQSDSVYADNVTISTLLTLQGNGVVEGNLVVQGTLIQTGNTEITTDTITINTGAVVNKDAFIENRRISGNNAVIKWNETTKTWQISAGNTYTTLYNILAESSINTSPIATSDTTVPSSSALRTAYLTAGSYANGAFVQANTALIHANAAYTAANNATDTWVRNAANSASSYANSAFNTANTASANASSGYAQANTATTNAASASSYANGAFARANTAQFHANEAFNTANSTISSATSASSYANGAFAKANTAQTHASAAFNLANTRYSASGGTISGDVTVTGNLTISGTTTTVNTQDLNVADNFILLNSDVSSGTSPSENAGVEVNRGSSAKVSLTWNESTDRWMFTNDGTVFSNMGSDAAEFYANSAYNQANTATTNAATAQTHANEAFNTANSAYSLTTSTTRDVQFNSIGVGTSPSGSAGDIRAIGDITAYYSDERLKTILGNIPNALDKINSLRGIYYINNDIANSFGYTSTKQQVGVIAQEIEQVLPEIVSLAPFDIDEKGTSKSGENYKTVQYDKIVPLLIEAIKELSLEIQNLKDKGSK